MHAVKKLQRISAALQDRGEPGNAAQIARLLNVSPSTVGRWLSGEVAPRGKQAESLKLLHRTVVQADDGNRDAKKILGMLLGGAGAGLLGLGLGGVLIAAGLGWVLGGTGDDGDDEELNND
jgi:transcriptional regulator with XRE-family HTH domain